MALGAELCNDVSQAHTQYSARKCGANTPVVCDAVGAIKIDVFEIGVSLILDVSEDLRTLGTFHTPPAAQTLDMQSQVT